MKVLFLSRYVEPESKGSNTNVVRQAHALNKFHGVNVEIITWPHNDLWNGPIPSHVLEVPPLTVERSGLIYHVFSAPIEWNEDTRVIDDDAWEAAVFYGMQVFSAIKPDLVHLQHRHGLWWLLDAAQRMGIPTVYSNHDWAIGCLRTMLVKGDGSLCSGVIEPFECARCIMSGRSMIGKANEVFVQTGLGRIIIRKLYSTFAKDALHRHGVLKEPADLRVRFNQKRANAVLAKLDALLTPSEFGKRFFVGLGTPAEKIHISPWYYDPLCTDKKPNNSDSFTITYVGRVSPEKGVHLIFSALEKIQETQPVHLKVAGANDSEYCLCLQEQYPFKVGIHKVEWLGWSDVNQLFPSTDVTIIPAIGMDNTPLSLIESLSYRVPVIITRIPTIEALVQDNFTGFLFEYRSVESLAQAIKRAIDSKNVIREGRLEFPRIPTVEEYTRGIRYIYDNILIAQLIN